MVYYPPKSKVEKKIPIDPIELFPGSFKEREVQSTLFDEAVDYIAENPTIEEKSEPIQEEGDSFILTPEDWREPEPVERSKSLILYVPLIQREEQIRQRKTYSQDWASYDLAKTNEEGLFKALIEELLSNCVEVPEHKKAGRRGYSVREKLLFMCLKVYYKSDLRKTVSILKELKKVDYIPRVPSFKSIDNFFNDKSLSLILDDLILISALPLANVEEVGAIDATGFSISKFQRWFDFKWGKLEGKERIWRKAHVCIGCKTNVFLSVKVTESNVADAKMTEEVIGMKTKYFDMKDFVADKAYLCRRIIKFLDNLGLEIYIPFKSNSVGKPKGCRLWRVMFEKFHNENEDYMKKYHRRSNIETAFFMVKQNFGDNILTKNLEANINEIKVKFLCQNISTLIQEAYERDIEIDFESCVKMMHSV